MENEREPAAFWVERLTQKGKAGCAAMEILRERSAFSDEVYPYFDRFVSMLAHENSYERNRALVLIAANARWDREGRLEGCLEEYLYHVADEKPITARQCIQNLPEIARAQPRLAARIAGRLKQADPSRYQDSMAPLIAKDIAAALRKIEAMLQS